MEIINDKLSRGFKKILLKDEQKFFHGLSFVIISLIAVHVVLYFNFYKFSSNWINLESQKTTFILTNNNDEKEIPLSVSENIKDYLINNSIIDSYKIIDSLAIKNILGLDFEDEISGLDLPMVFQVISSEKKQLTKFIKISLKFLKIDLLRNILMRISYLK